MSFSPGPKDVQIAISVFGGLVTEMTAPDLPEGVSPDCQDVVFVPGSVASRPALNKVFATPFPGTPGVTYAKSYVTPAGGIFNLYLDSNGALWQEDVVATPGTYTEIGTLTGPWAKSITAFGREYIAASDGLRGADIPLQWDGINLDRVTQDGPGAPPNVASLALPAVSMTPTGSTNLALTESDPAGHVPTGGFTSINTWTAASVAGINPGDAITISGYTGASAAMNGQWTVLAVYTGGSGAFANLIQLSAALPAGTVFSTAAANGAILTGAMVRQGNVVTLNCATAHSLQVGYQALISNVTASTVGTSITSIVIANESNPGIALVTTSTPHGLLPGLYVSISGVNATVAGGSIANIFRAGQIVTVTTASAHSLSPGAVVTIQGVTPASFNSTVQVLNVNSTTVFTYAQVDVDATGSGGTVNLNWPIPMTATPTYFEVLAAPTPTSFQVSVNYSDGTWNSGIVQYAWDGTFFVTAVPSPTTFQYQQYGPNATTGAAGGTVTPFGQAAPGLHQCEVLFLTRQGAITRPSPPVQFMASGGQYVSVTNIPIGPPNVIARILAFTGASGARFFYIPYPPQVNGQIVGTATQINDNTTTALVVDFSDPTLFSSTAVDIPGNDLAAQIVLDSVLGFGYYAGRLVAWGMRNRVQNFLNLSFDGGQFYNAAGGSASNFPCGWLVGSGASGGGALVTTGRWGWAWQPSAAGSIYQSAYQDDYGAPILDPNTPYRLRAWIKGAGGSLTVTISSATSGFSSTATVNGTASGGFAEANFTQKMPEPIPSDMRLTLTWTGTPTIDELSILYQQTPYLDSVFYASYVDNPEGFDGVTGKFGSSQDEHKIMEIAELRQSLYFLTRDPGGRLHETNDNGVTEPAGWVVDEISANCGVLSTFALTKAQADHSSAAGGEEWFAWSSATGARIFGGDQPRKISQEIEPDWESINPAYQGTAWTLNDPVARVIYFGLPLAGSQGTPNRILAVNYRGLDSAYEIGTTGAIRTGFTGRLIATDHARKWTRWSLAINGSARMYRQPGLLQPVFFCGNGALPGAMAAPGNVYTLNPAKYTDDDYGRISPYYTTYFAPTHDQEQALQLGGQRKLLVYLEGFVTGIGQITITPLCDTLANPWKITGTRALTTAPTYDFEWVGGNVQAQRIALKFASAPAGGGTDNSFNLEKVITTLRRAVHLPVRGAAY